MPPFGADGWGSIGAEPPQQEAPGGDDDERGPYDDVSAQDDALSTRAIRPGAQASTTLTWTLRPWPNATGGWTASVTTWLEAGEQMSSLASVVEDFLSAGQP